MVAAAENHAMLPLYLASRKAGFLLRRLSFVFVFVPRAGVPLRAAYDGYV
jgi:hypothetical protein